MCSQIVECQSVFHGAALSVEIANPATPLRRNRIPAATNEQMTSHYWYVKCTELTVNAPDRYMNKMNRAVEPHSC